MFCQTMNYHLFCSFKWVLNSPLCTGVTLSKNDVMFSGVKLSIRSFVLLLDTATWPCQVKDFNIISEPSLLTGWL